mmetsp:Transcript_20733/g.29200  ORF Transcript_20733/g.29200 Transcript_20733/m.29200 type:complete len:96 (+) Transcript_20733:297-584(+)
MIPASEVKKPVKVPKKSGGAKVTEYRETTFKNRLNHVTRKNRLSSCTQSIGTIKVNGTRNAKNEVNANTFRKPKQSKSKPAAGLTAIPRTAINVA